MLDAQTDAQLAALLALLKAAINAELSVLDDVAVASTHAWPIGAGRLPAGSLPALACWRQSGGFLPRITGPHDQRVTLRFLYLLPPTPLDRVGLRWPLLNAVWNQLATTLLAGHHTAHSADADVLTAVGFIDVDIAGASVTFTTPAVDADVQPQFEATIAVTIRPTSDSSGLDDLSLLTELHPADLPEAERPLVSELHE